MQRTAVAADLLRGKLPDKGDAAHRIEDGTIPRKASECSYLLWLAYCTPSVPARRCDYSVYATMITREGDSVETRKDVIIVPNKICPI